MPLAKFDRPVDGFDTALDAVYATIDQLAGLAADLGGHTHRDVPRLGPSVVGDQIAVLVHEITLCNKEKGDQQAGDLLIALRRLLP